MSDEQKLVLDFGKSKRGQLDESMMDSVSCAIEQIMMRLFGASLPIPVLVKGTMGQIESFTKALAGEKKYMDAIQKYGLDNEQTYKSQSQLQQAVSGFESQTNIKWPFK
jgi:hypothetical protein